MWKGENTMTNQHWEYLYDIIQRPVRKPLRLRNSDYSEAGYYFVTICTQNRVPWFGEIIDGEMCLNQAGSIAQSEWLSLPRRFPGLQLDLFVVMPNHLHGLLLMPRVKEGSEEENVPRSTVGRMIDLFKGAATFRIRATVVPDFVWQRSFYDSIVRSPLMLENVRHYIVNNPTRWVEDTLAPKG